MWYSGSVAAFTRQLQLREYSVLYLLHSGQDPYFSLILSCKSWVSELPNQDKVRLVCWCFSRRKSSKKCAVHSTGIGAHSLKLCLVSTPENVSAATACTFSTSQRPKVVRTPSVLCILKCASRHNGAQFFIAPVASWLRTRRFSKPTFRPSGATNHWKNIVFRDFPPFCASASSFFLTLSLLLFSLLIFLFERRHHWSLESGFRN